MNRQSRSKGLLTPRGKGDMSFAISTNEEDLWDHSTA
jgi:hypothetical protein